MAPYRPDESNIGVWFWLVLLLDINATWILMDIWLRRHNHEYLTTEFREALKDPLWGAVIVFLLAGSVAMFVWHMFNTRDTAPRG